MAPIGMGRPMKSPLVVLTQAKRASRMTPASNTDAAATMTSRNGICWLNPAQMTTMKAGAKPKLITSARLSSSAPMAEARNFRATRPSNRSQMAPISSSTTAVPKKRGSAAKPLPSCSELMADQASMQTARNPQRALPSEESQRRRDEKPYQRVPGVRRRSRPSASWRQPWSRPVTPATVLSPTDTAGAIP